MDKLANLLVVLVVSEAISMLNQYNTWDINNKLLYRCNNYVYHVAILYVVVQFLIFLYFWVW